MHELPCVEPERPSVIDALGDIKGARCLDLACGTGRYSRLLINDLHGSSVTGYDISPVMIDGAQKASANDSRFSFAVADCSTTLPEPPSSVAYDVIFAGWFLNYAGNEAELTSMFRNISTHLSPAGKFVGITSNALRDGSMYPMEDWYGVDIRIVGEVEGGWRLRLTSHTDPVVEFEMFHLTLDVYERAAKKAGLRLEWLMQVVPDDERKGTGFWDGWLARPDFVIVRAFKVDLKGSRAFIGAEFERN